MIRFKNLYNFVNHFQGKLKHNIDSLSMQKKPTAISHIKVLKSIKKNNDSKN